MRSRSPILVLLAVVATLGSACAGPAPTSTDPDPVPRRLNSPTAPAPTPAHPALPAPQQIRVAEGDSWVDTGCTMFPADNHWHADVRGLPTLEPRSPDGRALSEFPVDTAPDQLRLRAGLRGSNNKTITWSSDADPMRWVAIEGSWSGNAEYSAVEVLQIGPLSQARNGLLRHRVPDEVLIELSSTDDHALFVDTDSCTLTEYIRWSRFPGGLTANTATVNDLATNERRLSVRPGWLSPGHNGSTGAPIDSPYTWTNPNMSGMDGNEIHAPRSGAGASGGSGLPSSPGMVRLDEVFADPSGSSEQVDPDGRIDHAIAAVLPMRNISPMPNSVSPGQPAPFAWPATTSDGCATVTCPDSSTGSQFHVPMGSRLRLGEQQCDRDWAEPQAEMIVRAMCEHGIVVTDSSGQFSISTERSTTPGGSKWRSAAEAELGSLTLRDFELVDIGSVAAHDADLLWESGVTWAVDRYGSGSQLPPGWFQGTFWGSFTRCDRAPHTYLDLQRPRCTDPLLAALDDSVNSADWLRVEP